MWTSFYFYFILFWTLTQVPHTTDDPKLIQKTNPENSTFRLLFVASDKKKKYLLVGLVINLWEASSLLPFVIPEGAGLRLWKENDIAKLGMVQYLASYKALETMLHATADLSLAHVLGNGFAAFHVCAFRAALRVRCVLLHSSAPSGCVFGRVHLRFWITGSTALIRFSYCSVMIWQNASTWSQGQKRLFFYVRIVTEKHFRAQIVRYLNILSWQFNA